LIELRAGSYFAVRCQNLDPVSVADTARLCLVWVYFDVWVFEQAAQPRKVAVLPMTELMRFY
jgi:hypothetical protein